MRILIVSQIYPWPLNHGTRQRVFHLVSALASRHDVTLISVAPSEVIAAAKSGADGCPLLEQCAEVDWVDFNTFLNMAEGRFHIWAPFLNRVQSLLSSSLPGLIRHWHSPALLEKLRRFKREQRFDLVWAERCYMAEMVHRAGFERVVVDLDDIESVSLRRTLDSTRWYRSKPVHRAELWKLERYERRMLKRFHRLLVCKADDREFLGGTEEQVRVVPNGVVDFPCSPAESERAGELLFVGTMSYEPNVDAVTFLTRHVLDDVRKEVPEAALHIVGREVVTTVSAMHDGASCIVHGEVPDVTPYFDTAAVVVAPIRLGSGTRLKVLEALARGKALVATTIATEGLDLRPGLDYLRAETPQEFVAACVKLLRDPGLRAQLGASGRARVLDLYHWDRIGETALAIAEEAAGSPRAASLATTYEGAS